VYADDNSAWRKIGLLIIALLDMMDTLRRFLKDRKLELCAEKMKIIVFNK